MVEALSSATCCLSSSTRCCLWVVLSSWIRAWRRASSAARRSRTGEEGWSKWQEGTTETGVGWGARGLHSSRVRERGRGESKAGLKCGCVDGRCAGVRTSTSSKVAADVEGRGSSSMRVSCRRGVHVSLLGFSWSLLADCRSLGDSRRASTVLVADGSREGGVCGRDLLRPLEVLLTLVACWSWDERCCTSTALAEDDSLEAGVWGRDLLRPLEVWLDSEKKIKNCRGQ